MVMTYEQAIAQVKAGNSVKRSGWGNHYLRKQPNTTGELVVETVFVRTTIAPYTATQDDIVTDDWQTV